MANAEKGEEKIIKVILKKIISNLGLQTVPMQPRKTLQSGVRVENTFHKCI